MQELSVDQVEQVGGGFIVVATLAVIDLALIAYDAYKLDQVVTNS